MLPPEASSSLLKLIRWTEGPNLDGSLFQNIFGWSLLWNDRDDGDDGGMNDDWCRSIFLVVWCGAVVMSE